MNEKELTPWFDGTIKPVRKGVYMLMSGASVGYQKWDGIAWSWWCLTADQAARCKKGDYASYSYQCDKWRGLCEKPKSTRDAP